jgi:1-acyl-sn-glycerol-3-phosphate acyltransferase
MKKVKLIRNKEEYSLKEADNLKFLEDNFSELKKRDMTRRMIKYTVKRNPLSRFFRWLFYYLVYYPVFAIFNRIVFGLKVIGKKNLKNAKKNGCVTICNHVHKLDNTFCARAVYPGKPFFTSLQSNFSLKGAGGFLKMLGVVPTPLDFTETKVFFSVLGEMLRQKKVVHFYPEGELTEYNEDLGDFQKGAFFLAATANKPVVPMRVVYRKRNKPGKKPKMSLIIGEPLYPDNVSGVYKAADDLMLRAAEAMRKLGD